MAVICALQPLCEVTRQAVALSMVTYSMGFIYNILRSLVQEGQRSGL